MKLRYQGTYFPKYSNLKTEPAESSHSILSPADSMHDNKLSYLYSLTKSLLLSTFRKIRNNLAGGVTQNRLLLLVRRLLGIIGLLSFQLCLLWKYDCGRIRTRRIEKEQEPQISKNGKVVAVSLCRIHSFSKVNQESINLIKGCGVEGDAHFGKTVQHRSRVAVDPNQPNLRQVHLIHVELFQELVGYDILPGQLGENITTQRIFAYSSISSSPQRHRTRG